MSVPLKAQLRALYTWGPLNRVVTDILRVALPQTVKRRPRFVRYARRVGVVEAGLPNGRLLRMTSRGDDNIVAGLFWRGWAGYEPETARVFYELACSARVTLDIGANVGYFALLASHANPAGQVYAFEPLDRARARLERNIALNGASNVAALRVAAGSPAGTAEFFHVKQGVQVPTSSSLSQSFMQSIVSTDELTSSKVEVVEIDDFVESRGLPGVDLMKVDTEATEDAVFRGMSRTLARDRPDIVCEVMHAGMGAAIEGLLRPLGYEFFRLTGAGPVRCEHLTTDPRWRNFIFRARGRAAAPGLA